MDRWGRFNDVLIDAASSTDDVHTIDATRSAGEVESDVRGLGTRETSGSAPNLTNHRAVDQPARTSDDHGVPTDRTPRDNHDRENVPSGPVLKAKVECSLSGTPSARAPISSPRITWTTKGLEQGRSRGVNGFAHVRTDERQVP